MLDWKPPEYKYSALSTRRRSASGVIPYPLSLFLFIVHFHSFSVPLFARRMLDYNLQALLPSLFALLNGWRAVRYSCPHRCNCTYI